MASLPKVILRFKYEKAAEEYLRSLTLEDFMEARPQATQRKITLESFDLVNARRGDVHVFDEMLVQYPLRATDDEVGQVVPDNMVVVYEGALDAETSYDLPWQPARPLLVMEYASKNSKRKDFEISFDKYERELKVPYYLLFYPDNQDMTLFHLRKGKYVSVKPDERDRCAVPELDLEVAMLDGWVRYWFRGELLPLPADLQRELEHTRKELARQKRRANKEAKRAKQEAVRADSERQARLKLEDELAHMKAELERLRADNS